MYPSSDLLDRAIRSGGYTQTTIVRASRGGRPVYDGDLPVVADAPNSVQDKAGDGVRRTLTLEVKSERGLLDALAPTGTTLQVWTQLNLGGDRTHTIPMGVFETDVEQLGLAPGSTLQLTCPDKWARVQRSRFLVPQASAAGQPITEQIATLIRGAFTPNEPVLNYTRGLWTVSPLVWEQDRDKAITDLATSVGVSVSFNRVGQCEIRDLPQIGDNAVWLVDASPTGVLASGTRKSTRSGVYNVVKVTGEAAGEFGPGFAPVYAWDSDPDSPTYAGPDPINHPELAGPFGVAVYPYSSATIRDQFAALQAANTILAKVVGLAKTVTVEAGRHPCLDAYDPIKLMPLAEGGTGPRTVERHLIDQVTHPLSPQGTQSIVGRSTRTDPYQ